MKSALIISLMLLLAFFASAADDPFASDTSRSQPERKISIIPKAVTYTIKEGKHVYAINGIYEDASKAPANERESNTKAMIPDCEDCHYDFEKSTFTMRTTRKLTNTELADTIDQIASMVGCIPYWIELEARDIEKSKEFVDIDFVLNEFKGELPNQLAWFHVDKKQPTELPLGIAEMRFKIFIVPTTAFCMCHSRYCIRILDPSGKVVWQDNTTAYASVSIAVAALTNDTMQNGYIHELLIRRNDHGTEKNFIVKIKNKNDHAEKNSNNLNEK